MKFLAMALLLGLAALASCREDRLPVIERPAAAPEGTLAVIVTGDGGWTAIDRVISRHLGQRGISVVGLSSPRYFWTRRSPEQAGRDLERLVRTYLAAWQQQRVLLIGYSRGADVLPFMAARLPEDLRDRLVLIALLGPEPSVGFEFHALDLIDGRQKPGDLPVFPQVRQLDPGKVACVHGSAERYSLCPQLAGTGVSVLTVAGGHHFDHRYDSIAALILREVDRRRP